MKHSIRLDRSNGHLDFDGVSGGCLESTSATDGYVTIGPLRYTYSARPWLVQGYELGLSLRASEICKLSSHWREGTVVACPGESEYTYYQNHLTRDGKELAELVADSNSFTVTSGAELSESRRTELACLLILNSLYRAREGAFAR
jgi:hypothetical protein